MSQTRYVVERHPEPSDINNWQFFVRDTERRFILKTRLPLGKANLLAKIMNEPGPAFVVEGGKLNFKDRLEAGSK